MNGSKHGAFAAILNARVGWFDPQYPWKYSGEFQAKLFEALLQREHSTLGQANQRGKEALVGQVEASGAMTYRWCYYSITLLGDPHVPFHLTASPPTRVESRPEMASVGRQFGAVTKRPNQSGLFGSNP